jgi:hypothetical protein
VCYKLLSPVCQLATKYIIAYFNWLLDDQVNTPFYGGYFAALTVAGADHIIASDSGTNSYAQYVIFKAGRPSRIVLINTDYYSGKGKRSRKMFTLTGLISTKVEAVRLTAPSSEVVSTLRQQKPALEPSFGGKVASNLNSLAVLSMTFGS